MAPALAAAVGLAGAVPPPALGAVTPFCGMTPTGTLTGPALVAAESTVGVGSADDERVQPKPMAAIHTPTPKTNPVLLDAMVSSLSEPWC